MLVRINPGLHANRRQIQHSVHAPGIQTDARGPAWSGYTVPQGSYVALRRLKYTGNDRQSLLPGIIRVRLPCAVEMCDTDTGIRPGHHYIKAVTVSQEDSLDLRLLTGSDTVANTFTTPVTSRFGNTGMMKVAVASLEPPRPANVWVTVWL